MLAGLVMVVFTPSLLVVLVVVVVVVVRRTREQLVVSAYQAWPAPVLGAVRPRPSAGPGMPVTVEFLAE